MARYESVNAPAINAGLPGQDVQARFVHATVFVSGWLLVLLGAWMCGRRAFGGIQRPLPFEGFCILALLLVGLASLIRVGWFWSIPRQVTHRKWKWFGLVVPATGVVLLVGSVSLPSSPWPAMAVCWTIVVCVELAWAFLVFRGRQPLAVWSVFQRFGRSNTSHSNTPPTETMPAVDLDVAGDSPGIEFDEGFSQSLTRQTLPDGNESVTGLLRGLFRPKQRSENLHVAFCPPLETIPHIHCVQVSGTPARIKIGDVQTFGARFELKLTSTHDEDSEVVIHFVAQTTKNE